MIVDEEEDEASDNGQAAADETGDNAEGTANDEQLAWQLQVSLLHYVPEMTAMDLYCTALDI